tara:strand:- start:18247 stop:20322 length:2076 start_codon:yes stop_codon:yes gene_type:complete
MAAPSVPNRGGLRVLFVTLEFRAGAFSGNGVYAQSQARALAKRGYHVHVVCGSPEGHSHEGAEYDDPPNLTVIEVPVPSETWGRLDAGCGWREFAAGAGSDLDLARTTAAFKPDVVLGVDWHSLPTTKSLSKLVESLAASGKTSASPEDGSVTVTEAKNTQLIAPFMYSNFRVFSRTDSDAHRSLELDAVASARGVVCLCGDDADFIANNLHPPGVAVAPRIVLPPLREDVRMSSAAQSRASEDLAETCDANRTYLTCVVRLSPEKEAERFVNLVGALARRGVFDWSSKKPNIFPVLCASTKGPYADSIRTAFKVAAKGRNCLIIEKFLDADGLRELYEKTLLNFHPCKKDAYGMTIVEAGAFGAPSVVQRGGGVGANSTLREARGASIGVEFVEDFVSLSDSLKSVEQIADIVEKWLGDRPALRRVGECAKKAALAWDETANANAVSHALHAAVDAFRDENSIGDRRWRLVSPQDIEKLQRLWRDATLGLWVGGDWAVVQHSAACGVVPSVGNSPEWRFGSGKKRGRKRKASSNSGNTEVTTQMVIVTSHNPMGVSRDDATNDIAASELANDVRGMREEGFITDVFPCVSVDAKGGAEVWCEPGLAVTLSSHASFEGLMRLARKYGQAAVYALSGDSDGNWKLAVKPCFPELEGLGVENVPLITRELPWSMPSDPSDARCFWESEPTVGL